MGWKYTNPPKPGRYLIVDKGFPTQYIAEWDGKKWKRNGVILLKNYVLCWDDLPKPPAYDYEIKVKV